MWLLILNGVLGGSLAGDVTLYFLDDVLQKIAKYSSRILRYKDVSNGG